MKEVVRFLVTDAKANALRHPLEQLAPPRGVQRASVACTPQNLHVWQIMKQYTGCAKSW